MSSVHSDGVVCSIHTDQLMARSIQLKQPELEEKRLQLLQNEGQLGKQKLELQDKLLVELSSATGDILKNEVTDFLNEILEPPHTSCSSSYF